MHMYVRMYSQLTKVNYVHNSRVVVCLNVWQWCAVVDIRLSVSRWTNGEVQCLFAPCFGRRCYRKCSQGLPWGGLGARSGGERLFAADRAGAAARGEGVWGRKNREETGPLVTEGSLEGSSIDQYAQKRRNCETWLHANTTASEECHESNHRYCYIHNLLETQNTSLLSPLGVDLADPISISSALGWMGVGPPRVDTLLLYNRWTTFKWLTHRVRCLFSVHIHWWGIGCGYGPLTCEREQI